MKPVCTARLRCFLLQGNCRLGGNRSARSLLAGQLLAVLPASVAGPALRSSSQLPLPHSAPDLCLPIPSPWPQLFRGFGGGGGSFRSSSFGGGGGGDFFGGGMPFGGMGGEQGVWYC